MQKKFKPRNPMVALAKFRQAGTHAKPKKALRRQDKQALAKAVKDSAVSCHKRICSQMAFAMAPLFGSQVSARA